MALDVRRLAAASEDAFDAAVSALAMAAAEELLALPDEPGYALEGKIWQPRVSVYPKGSAAPDGLGDKKQLDVRRVGVPEDPMLA